MQRTAKVFWMSLAFASLSFAATISFPDGEIDSVSAACTNFAGYTCTTDAYFDGDTLGEQNAEGISSLFTQAFSAWNSTNAPAAQWTLNLGGTLTGTFNIDPAVAGQFDSSGDPAGDVISGGLTIKVSVSDITLPTLSGDQQLVWAQGLYDNYLLDGSIVSPFYEMDISGACPGTLANPIACPPAYPFQYLNDMFYDQPKASYKAPGSAQAFFDANAYLSVIDYNTRTLTVYDGVSYGFANFVTPEPGTWLLLGSGIVLIAFRYRRRST